MYNMSTSLGDSPTLGSLLARRDLDLRAAGELDAATLAARVQGVHSSDLADPTPFLAEGLVLLTTGTQFLGSDDDSPDFDAYVARLRGRGITALGFGTEVVREGIPRGLDAACRAYGLPLFEVPYRTPFIAVARANAQAIAAEEYARRSWALAAGRALSLAALRADGLAATLDELARQLSGWVGMFDAAGALIHEHPAGSLDAATRDDLRDEVSALLRRGARAGSSLHIGSTPFHVQTLGRGGRLRGAIAVSAEVFDREARGVVTTAVAMAGLALEQRQTLAQAMILLRSGLAEALLAGDGALVRRVSKPLWGSLGTGAIAIGLTDAEAARREDVLQWLESAVAARGGSLFFGRIEDGLLLAAPVGDGVFAELAAKLGLRVGVSAPATLDTAPVGLAQARVARERASAGSLAAFAEVRGGLLSVLDDERVGAIARAELEPLLRHDAEHATALVTTLDAWLAADTAHEAAARALGVHRHTVRARLSLTERVLGVDLSSFAVRAQLWLALRALD